MRRIKKKNKTSALKNSAVAQLKTKLLGRIATPSLLTETFSHVQLRNSVPEIFAAVCMVPDNSLSTEHISGSNHQLLTGD